MRVYLVGGAVRDMIMGVKSKDYDYVIVNASQADLDQLQKDGFKQVGADFPVFLDPINGHEYALARTERKVGPGYSGFECQTENVTLEQDLQRRDLTMNAIAWDARKSEYIDPYGGREDIKNKIIRHVSEAFAEDPVRVLRVARFAARYGFHVHETTNALMQKMVKNGEVNNLQRERVMQEIIKCVDEGSDPVTFVKVLCRCGAWQVLFPEIPAPNKEHQALIKSATTMCATVNAMSYFTAALFGVLSPAEIETIQARMVFPKQYFRFASTAAKTYKTLGEFNRLKAEEVVSCFDDNSIQNKGGEGFLMELNNFSYCAGSMTRAMDDYVLHMYDLYSSVDAATLIEEAKEAGEPLVGRAIRDKLYEIRVQKIKEVIG